MQARIIDKEDENYDSIGNLVALHDDGRVEVYFYELLSTLIYQDYQIEMIEDDLSGFPFSI